MAEKEKIVWKIAGQAGGGQQLAGLVLAKTCLARGLFSFVYSQYPSRLRGGLVTSQVIVSKEQVFSSVQETDVFFALSQEAFDHGKKDLSENAWLFYDRDKVKNTKGLSGKLSVYPFSLSGLLGNNNLKPTDANSLILGITVFLINGDLNSLKTQIKKGLNGKNQKIVKRNQKAAQVGWRWAQKNLTQGFPCGIKSDSKNKKIILTGNEAVSLGALAADCRFYSSYPMTPSSGVLHALAKWTDKTKMIVSHPEDEIGAINLAIGASWAGVRSMVGTSGGGFSLMVEGLALAAMTETPLVIIESQRPGPATGLATWTEQGDLAFLAKVGHGYFPRIILAPGTISQAFYFTQLAFNLADFFQLPVFILLDKFLSESHQTVDLFNFNQIRINRGRLLAEKDLAKAKNYQRYFLTKGGISPRSIPGQKNGMFLANGNEHDQFGLSLDGFDREMRKKQMEKRAGKIEKILKNLPQLEWYGSKKSDLTLIGWGSVKGPVLEAMKGLNQEENKVSYLHIPAPYPLDKKLLERIIGKRKTIVIENNYNGQLADLMQESLGRSFDERLNKYSGEQFLPQEIIKALKKF